jgi:SAM-dependent methyltransferase
MNVELLRFFASSPHNSSPHNWQTMNNNDWYRYYAPRRLAELSPERVAAGRTAAERDIDAVLAHTDLQPSDRILEIGCGWGRHSLALAGRGFGRVRSIDIAPEPLTIARALAAEAELPCQFAQQDFIGIEEHLYSAVLSLYDRSVCGFPTEAEDARSLRRIAGILEPGGWLVFGIDDWPFHLPGARRDWHITPDGCELIEVLPDRAAMTCTDRVTLLRDDGRRECYELTRRHYYLPDLRRLLADAGMALEVALHRLTASTPYGDRDEGLFVFARREGVTR